MCFKQPGHDPTVLFLQFGLEGAGVWYVLLCRCCMYNLAATLLHACLQLRVGGWWGLVYTVNVLCNLADTQLISPASGWRVVGFGIQCRCRWPCVQYVSPGSPGRTIVLDLSTDIPPD